MPIQISRSCPSNSYSWRRRVQLVRVRDVLPPLINTLSGRNRRRARKRSDPAKTPEIFLWARTEGGLVSLPSWRRTCARTCMYMVLCLPRASHLSWLIAPAFLLKSTWSIATRNVNREMREVWYGIFFRSFLRHGTWPGTPQWWQQQQHPCCSRSVPWSIPVGANLIWSPAKAWPGTRDGRA